MWQGVKVYAPSYTKLFLCWSIAAKYSFASFAEDVPRPVGYGGDAIVSCVMMVPSQNTHAEG